ncbi:hypothetical protein KGQ34_00610 [Patescibacteria group bacterium]|nr:hypothetical protein [Patescibacteria group bacterium]
MAKNGKKEKGTNRAGVPILNLTPQSTVTHPVQETPGKSEEHHGLVVFATDDDRIKFRNRFGIDSYPRKMVQAQYGTTPVSYEQAAEIAAPAAEFLKKLINKTADGPSGPCVLAGKGCVNSKFMFIPFSQARIDRSDPLQPKQAVVKTWDGEELVTVLKVVLPSGAGKTYHAFGDGRVSKREHGTTVFVSLDEAKMVIAEGKPILLYDGRYLVDRVNRVVVGPLCYLCEKVMREKHGKDAPRLTSKAAAEAEVVRLVAQDEADKEYQRRRDEREKERVAASAVALDELVLRSRRPSSKFSVGGAAAGSRKTQDWGRNRSRHGEQ